MHVLRASRLPLVSMFACSVAGAIAMGACGSEQASTTAAPDSGADAFDAGSPNPSPQDAGAGTDASTDAATDAATDGAVATNQGTWLSSSGVLPNAACTPWTLVDTAAAKNPVLSTGFVTLATDSNAENMYYVQTGADLVTPATLIIDARVRVASGSSSDASRAPAVVLARYGSPLRTVAFYLSTTEVFLTSADLTKGNAANVATTDSPHNYHIEVNTTTHAIDVKRDSVSTITGTAYVEPDVAATAIVAWGEGSILATGTSEWVSVTHNAHAPTTCP